MATASVGGAPMGLSVVVITYNKAREIPLILAGFQRQRPAAFPWELILVDDGSEDGTPETAAAHGAGLPLSIHALPHRGNRNLLRNHGMAVARGTRIAFLDGDIVPGPGFLREHGAEGGANTVRIAPRAHLSPGNWQESLGPILKDDIHYLAWCADGGDEREPHFSAAPLASQPHPWRFLHSHNFSCPAALIRPLAGFDTGLRYWGADDLELGYRLWKAGGEFAWVPTGGGVHLHHPSGGTRESYWKNLELFHRNFPSPEVELLFAEDRLQPDESLRAFAACDGKRSFASILEGGMERWGLSGRVLRIGVKADFGVPVPGLGLRPLPDSPPAEACLVSGKLAALGPVPFLIILEGAAKAAGQVFIVGDGEDLAPTLREIRSANPGRLFRPGAPGLEYSREGGKGFLPLAFHQHNLLDPFCQNYGFRSLAAHLRGIEGLNAFMLGRQETVATNDRYLRVDAPQKLPSRETFDGHVFVFHPLWNQEEGGRFAKPIRTFWGDIAFKDDGVFREIHRVFDLILFRTEADLGRYRSLVAQPKPAFALPPFIPWDAPAPAARRESQVFRMAALAKHSDDRLGLETILEAFAGEFSAADPVRLDIHLGDSHEYRLDNPYLSPSKNVRISEWCTRNQACCDRLAERRAESILRRLGEAAPKITIHRKDLHSAGVSDVLSRCDLVVNAQVFYITPWDLLAAVAHGVPVLYPDHLSEFRILAETGADTVATRPFPVGHSDFRLPPLGGAAPVPHPRSHHRATVPSCLRERMRAAFEAWRSGANAPGRRRAPPDIRGHNAGISQRLISILGEFAESLQSAPRDGMSGKVESVLAGSPGR